ncbi:cytochrome P450 [Flagelloscypha sp. PMI_526]|nr:cytochrome P450 [Flagelloscypha sp. PMI_526]
MSTLTGPPKWVLLTLAFAFSTYQVVRITSRRKRLREHRPPGPTPVPILGNLPQMPKKLPYKTYLQWTQEYGPIVYLDLAGKPAVLLGSHQAVFEILEKRSAIYSNRAELYMPGLLSGDKHMLFIQPNALWKRGRRASHQLLSPHAVKAYSPIQLSETFTAALRILHLQTPSSTQNQKDWLYPLKDAVGYSNFRIIYGIPKPSTSITSTGFSATSSFEEDIQRVHAFSDHLAKNMVPGKHKADIYPWMRYLPEMFAPWKKWAREHFEDDSRFFEKLVTDVEKRAVQGQSRPCLAKEYLEGYGKDSDRTDDAWIMAALFGGSTETTNLVLAWFVKIMFKFPTVQAQAQRQIDEVIGHERAPETSDLTQLPFVHAVLRETLRWAPRSSIGFAHVAAEDDFYEGYYIAKGTMILPSIMGLNYDKTLYGDDADDYNPSRFIDEKGQLKDAVPNTRDEGHISYGFGRRHCPGRHLANQSLLSFMTTLLWAFEIKPGKWNQADGEIDPADCEDVNPLGALHWPNLFKAEFKPRFEGVEALLEQGILTAEAAL